MSRELLLFKPNAQPALPSADGGDHGGPGGWPEVTPVHGTSGKKKKKALDSHAVCSMRAAGIP